VTLNGKDFIRYSRHLLMADVGEAGQEKLLQSRVLIVGLGGLGCPVALYLAAAGVGQISLCDPDRVELSNLQRQVLYRQADIGSAKVASARTALLELNSTLAIDAYPQTVDESLWQRQGFDLVLDCTDNLAARHWLNRQCHQTATTLITAAAMGWDGQLTAFDFRNHNHPCLACLIPENAPEPTANCANSGVIAPVLGVLGSMQALLAIRTLLGKAIVHGQLQRYDGNQGQWFNFHIAWDSECPVCAGK
jgi:molybdopterin/thiamine biosynthesis adenylyltransferase